LLVDLIDADARHLVLAPIGMPSAQWVADEIVEPVLAAIGQQTVRPAWNVPSARHR
jgi:hypothetical protein